MMSRNGSQVLGVNSFPSEKSVVTRRRKRLVLPFVCRGGPPNRSFGFAQIARGGVTVNSDQPIRPSASIFCFSSSLETLLVRAEDSPSLSRFALCPPPALANQRPSLK